MKIYEPAACFFTTFKEWSLFYFQRNSPKSDNIFNCVLLCYSNEKALKSEAQANGYFNVAPLWFIPLIIASYDITLRYYIKKTLKIQEGIYFCIKVAKMPNFSINNYFYVPC
jgi:hypothetical protein